MVSVPQELKYLGTVLHGTTKGMAAAIKRLPLAGRCAMQGMHPCSTVLGINEFATLARLY
jgi:hypothetical protein